MKYRMTNRFLPLALSVLALGAPRVRAQAPDETGAPAEQAVVEDPARREASTRFRRGVELYGEGNFEAALIEFQRTYDVAPSFRVLYNIGQAHLALRHYIDALQAFERYLEEGGDAVPAERREALVRQVQDLRNRTGTVMVRTSVPGATVSIDDEPRGTTPLDAPIALDVGRHRIEVRASGFEATTRAIALAGGENATLAFELVPLPTITVERGAEEVDHRRMRSVGRIGLIATGVLAIGAGITGGLSLGANSDLERELEMFPGDPSQIADARDRTRALSLSTDVLGGAALALGVTSLVLIVADARGHADDEEPTVAVGVTRSGVIVGGRF